MDLTFHEEQGVAVLCVAGELDDVHSSEVGQLFERLLGEGRRRFVLDLKGVNFIDSSGLAMLVRCFQHSRQSASRFMLADLPPAVLRTLNLTRLDRAFEIYTDADEAIQHCMSK